LLLEAGGYLLQEDAASKVILEPTSGSGRPIRLRAGRGMTFLMRAGVAAYRLRAAAARYDLKAAAARLDLRAGGLTRFTLRGSTDMSITQNLRFFRGEDVTLNFAMQPP
jgi:hypothetical protein